MTEAGNRSRCKATLQRPAKAMGDAVWAFVTLPKEVSEKLPRRGRTSVDGKLNGTSFQATLEPDGQLSHWLPVSQALAEAAAAAIGELVTLEVAPVTQEPEPAVPPDLLKALVDAPEARAVWDSATTIARIDWIHWITSAKQAKTRAQRVANACAMLASGKKRVCCFDPSGYYSKAFSAPQPAD
jgi:hypothetical protein